MGYYSQPIYPATPVYDAYYTPPPVAYAPAPQYGYGSGIGAALVVVVVILLIILGAMWYYPSKG